MSKKDKRTPGDQWSSDRNYKLPMELVQKFYDKAYKLAEKMFGLDCNGCLPVDIRITDRTRQDTLHYMEVPCRHEDQEKLDDRLDILAANLRIATEEISTEMKLCQHDRDQKRHKAKVEALQEKIFAAVDQGGTLKKIEKDFKTELEEVFRGRVYDLETLMHLVKSRIERR